VHVQSSDPPRLVRVGIDAAVVAQHEVCLRVTEADGRVRIDRFHVQPDAGRVAVVDRPAGGDAGGDGGRGADVDDLAGVVGGVGRRRLRSVAAGCAACGPLMPNRPPGVPP
jgi:hypothetical protein